MFKHLQLVDPDFNEPGPITSCLHHYAEILSDCPALIKREPAIIIAIFSFVIFGKIPIQLNTMNTLLILVSSVQLQVRAIE